MRRLARRPLERGQLLDLVDDPQPVGGVDQHVGGVLDESSPTRQRAQLVDQEGWRLNQGTVGVRLPADHSHVTAGDDALGPEDLGERHRGVTGLAGQAEILEADAPQGQWRGLGGGQVLVADE